MEQDQLDTYLRTCQALWLKEIEEDYILGTDPLPTMILLLQKVENSLSIAFGDLEPEDRQSILNEWQLEFTYEEPEITTIGHKKDPWYGNYLIKTKKVKKNFPFWCRYKAYMRGQGRIPASLDKLDKATDEIISFLGNPNDKIQGFEKKGLVVGYVQSGKTGNFIGLINKALDVGYDYIIVLGGIHNNLRSQTQRRVNEGVMGEDLSNGKKIGCGLIKNYQNHPILLDSEAHTSIKKDFKKNETPISPINATKHVFVVKKNVSILNNLSIYFDKIIKKYEKTEWVNKDGQLRNRSVLIIDDEADQASIDTKNYSKKERAETDPVSINKGIRDLLVKFEKSSYVGYTATPFANIFIDHEAEHKLYGGDLFPSSFITMLEKPNNYMGPYELFGTNDEKADLPLTRIVERDPDLLKTHLVMDEDLLKGNKKKYFVIPSEYGEDLNSIINWNDINVISTKKQPSTKEYNEALEDYVGSLLDVGDGWLPRIHSKDHDPMIWLNEKGKEIPSSLKKALDSFLLAVAAKLLRGQKTDHCSMLIHVTRYTDCQSNVMSMVKNYCDNNFGRILAEDKQTFGELKELWETDFITTSSRMAINKNFKGLVNPWDTIKPFLKKAVRVLQNTNTEANVMAIHGKSIDQLSYYDEPYDEEGFKVIAVGGDKLSRGLTLEGLMVSYFLRPTKMYDTLMQMGRWFGYRDGYADLCRVYSEKELLNNYKHISHAFEEVKELFKAMKREKVTPKEFGLRILDSDAMMITSAMKSRYSGTQSLKYSGNNPQTTLFGSSIDVLRSNEEGLNDFIRRMSKDYSRSYEQRGKSHVWNKVKTAEVVDYLTKYKGHHKQPNLSTSLLIEYIEKQMVTSPKELTEWTVVLHSLEKEDPKILNHNKLIGGKKIFPATRGLREDCPVDTFSLGVLSVQEPAAYDFPEKEVEKFKEENESYSGDKYALMGREKRPVKRGLIVLYPFIPTFVSIENDSLREEYKERYKTVDVVVGHRLHFPTSKTARAISYKSNTVMQELDIDNNEE